ncbi:Myb/SANT-like domain, harbinger transposase-derived nuclease domain protein [Tanacetum coccineum]
MGDTNLTFTPEQYKFFLESCIEEVNRVKAKGNSLHVESWVIVGKKLSEAFGLTTNQKQLKNKFDYYNGKYKAWAYLRGKTGNIYNEDTKTFNLTKEEWKDVSKRFKYGSSLKTSPLLYPELCRILFEKCSASGSIRRPVAEKRPSSQNSGVKLVEVEDDVNSFNKEGGSSAASEHVNLDAGYDSSFEDGSSKEPNVARGRRKKKSKKDSELGELEETMKNAISSIAAQENQGPTMDECHEKLMSMRLEPDDPIYLVATGIFCQSKSYREAWMLLPSIPNVLKKWIEMMARQLGF